MNYYPLRFQVNVTDNSMAPKLLKEDIVSIAPGCVVEKDHIAAVLVTDEVGKDTKLYIRKIETPHPGEVVLTSINREYPPLKFEGEATKNIYILGIVTEVYRTYENGWKKRGMVVTARIAQENRVALESHTGNIVDQ